MQTPELALNMKLVFGIKSQYPNSLMNLITQTQSWGSQAHSLPVSISIEFSTCDLRQPT